MCGQEEDGNNQEHGGQDLGWREAARQILQAAGRSMHYVDIAQKIGEEHLRKNLGVTPATSVNTAINLSINNANEGNFVRLGGGYYTLNENINGEENPAEEQNGDHQDNQAEGGNQQVAAKPTRNTIIQCFGMFWRTEIVKWKTGDGNLMGRQQSGADNVNFYQQRGVYLLHDRNRVIYVGRSTDRPLGQRLCEHTKDRLNGRWDRFSWFGLRAISDNGELEEQADNYNFSNNIIIATLEMILIETLEPPQNRKRGDVLDGTEFIQAEDTEFETQRRQTMADAFSALLVQNH